MSTRVCPGTAYPSGGACKCDCCQIIEVVWDQMYVTLL